MIPTEKWLDEAMQELVAMTTAPRIKAIRSKLGDAVERDVRGGRIVIDGFPSSTDGGGAGGSTESSTERAALVRVDLADRTLDAHHRDTVLAVRLLTQVNDGLFALWRVLERIAQTTGTRPVMTERCEAPGCKNPPSHTGNVAGRLDRDLDLCESCYQRTYGTGSLPTREDVELRDRVGKWPRRRASGPKKSGRSGAR